MQPLHEVVSKNNNSLLHNEIITQSSPYWDLHTGVGYNICIVLVLASQQCIFGQGKLVMVLVQSILWNRCIEFCKIITRSINLKMLRLPCGTWIFTSSFIKHEQFDFSLLVKWEIYRKKSIFLYYLWLYQKTREMLLKSLIKIVRAHFPWSNLYLYIKLWRDHYVHKI